MAEVFAAKGGVRLPELTCTSQRDVRPSTLRGAVLSSCCCLGLAAALLAPGCFGLSRVPERRPSPRCPYGAPGPSAALGPHRRSVTRVPGAARRTTVSALCNRWLPSAVRTASSHTPPPPPPPPPPPRAPGKAGRTSQRQEAAWGSTGQ
ncbi:hypothetical protein HJG60_010433 [Phyllostomus discolor]|uniref:Uncharacterized protein n=1 Tax=Phyllostomus discolor TaxID=89673 RepID=A0A834AHA0_9CHIR|nr:hypothetical protein HJG60_010433 [Phyllostomus discolor]